MALPDLLEREVLAQWRKLQKDFGVRRSMNRQNLILWGRFGVLPMGKGGGGQSKRKMLPPETTAEILADVDVLENLNMRLGDIREIRRLGKILEDAPNFTPENSATEIKRLSDAFVGQQRYAAGVIGWLRLKHLGLRALYPDEPPSERAKFFETKGFQLFVIGLTAGFFAGYSINERGEAVKPADAPEPGDALKEFATARIDPTAQQIA